MDTRITILQEQLEARKLESLRLKKEQKKLRLENLKAKEQNLLKQIESYDRKIEESKKSLMIEIESKNMQTTKSSKKLDIFSSSNHSNISIFQNITNYKNNYSSETHSSHSQASDRKMPADEKNPNAFQDTTNYDTPVKSQHEIVTKPKLKFIDNITINNNNKRRSLQSLEINQVHKSVPLLKEPTTVKVNNSKESLKNLTDTNSNILKYHSVDTLIHTSRNLGENSKVETHLNNLNEVGNSTEVFSYNYSVSNQKMSNTSDDPELSSEKNLINEILKNSLDDITHNYSTTSSSNYSSIQRQFSFDPNVNDNEVLDEHYSPDFTSDDNTSEVHKLSKFSKHDTNVIESSDEAQNNESSYEEERSEGDVMFEDKTFIEHHSDSSDSVSKKINLYVKCLRS